MITTIEQYLSKNDVFVNNLGRIDSRYRAFQDEGPKGLMLHSVGTAQPDATVFIRSWNKAGVEKATHAFVTADAVYQTLPWNYRGWHAGGTANNAYIGVEMTEPNTIRYTGGSSWVDLDPVATEAFVRKTYANAVALFAALCRQFALDPLADGVIISHREGYQRGIASNHGDPEHLWSKFGLQMDGFRADVVAALRGGYRVLAGTYPDLAAAKAQARTLLTAGFSATVLEPSGNEITLTRTGTVRVNTSLNIRSGPGTGYSRAGSLKNGDTVTLIDERDGWGALLQGGWVSLGYIINA